MAEEGSDIRKRLNDAKCIVVKVGTHLLLSSSGGPDERRIGTLVREISRIVRSGRQVVLVSSGAIGCGLEVLGKKTRPTTLPDLQMAAALGQTRLMSTYERLFAQRKLKIAQVLLTHDDLNNRGRHLNARNTILTLLRNGIIPVINENDAVSVDEIKFGDNDMLAALVALLVDADALILLTTVNGVRKPTRSGKNVRVSHIKSVTQDILKFALGKGSVFSVGGMNTKLQAAQMVAKAGGLVVIADGREKQVLARIIEGEDLGTVVGGGESRAGHVTRRRKRWLAFFHRARGGLVVDEGARAAVEEKCFSLLPIGVTEVRGSFEVGALVNVFDQEERLIARGLVEYSSEQIELIKGRKTSEISEILGAKYYDEVIHRDNMVVLAGQEGEVL